MLNPPRCWTAQQHESPAGLEFLCRSRLWCVFGVRRLCGVMFPAVAAAAVPGKHLFVQCSSAQLQVFSGILVSNWSELAAQVVEVLVQWATRRHFPRNKGSAEIINGVVQTKMQTTPWSYSVEDLLLFSILYYCKLKKIEAIWSGHPGLQEIMLVIF